MRAQVIAQMAWHLPVTDDTEIQAAVLAENYSKLPGDRVTDIVHYAKCHSDLAFGIHVAEALAESGKPFPALLHGDDLWVWRAYRYLKGDDDPVIAAVYALTIPDNKVKADQLKALLVVDGMTNAHAAKETGLPKDVVDAYEKLFFNVQDRKEDHAFIASVVYPEGRMSEAREDYVDNTDYGTLLMRAGFTRGADSVLFGMGVRSNPHDRASVAEIVQDLDKRFLADGLLYAEMGWANTKNHARPIRNAMASLVAGKAGGEDTSGDTMLMLSPSEALTPEIARLADEKIKARARRASLPG